MSLNTVQQRHLTAHFHRYRNRFLGEIRGRIRHACDDADVTARGQEIIDSFEAIANTCLKQLTLDLSIYTPKREIRRSLSDTLDAEFEEAKGAFYGAIRAAAERERQREILLLDAVLANIAAIERYITDGCFRRLARRLPRKRSFSSDNRYGKDIYWSGADVVINDEPLPAYNGSRTVVITEHGQLLTALFYLLRDEVRLIIDFQGRYEFYITIAETVNAHLEQTPEPTSDQLLSWANQAAQQLITTWKGRLG